MHNDLSSEIFENSRYREFSAAAEHLVGAKTYGAVHMPAAHISTDGCEALSAILKFPMQRIFFAEAENFPLQRKIPGAGNFRKPRNFEIL